MKVKDTRPPGRGAINGDLSCTPRVAPNTVTAKGRVEVGSHRLVTSMTVSIASC